MMFGNCWDHWAALRDQVELKQLLKIVLLFELALIVAYLALGAGELYGLTRIFGKLDLDNPLGVASTWNYGKLLAAALVLVAFYRPTSGTFALWLAALFLGLFADDYAEMHEIFSVPVGEALNSMFATALPDYAIGELSVYMLLFLYSLACLAMAYRFARTDEERELVVSFVVLVLVLAAFGVGVDTFHSAIDELFGTSLLMNVFLVAMEDGGEMLTITLMLANAFAAFEGLRTRPVKA